MLDYEKVIAQLSVAVPRDTRSDDTRAWLVQLWIALIEEYIRKGTLDGAEQKDFPLPVQCISRPDELPKIYTICGVDGSQIYPDRHSGLWAYLINTATVVFSYDTVSSVHYNSFPEVGIGGPLSLLTPDMINGLRTEREFAAGRAWALESSGEGRIVLFDGALIFWHLLSKEPAIKHRFLTSYCTLLRDITATGVLCASYISAPHARELLKLLEWYAVRTGIRLSPDRLEELTDTDLLELVLKPGETTPLFEHRFAIADLYGAELTPHFFYVHTGYEIARVELLRPTAQPEALSRLVSIICDQNNKGDGYPIALSEAHEHAVVRAADREFFEMAVGRMGGAQDGALHASRKLVRKRSAPV
jgi:hypothetical protein